MGSLKGVILNNLMLSLWVLQGGLFEPFETGSHTIIYVAAELFHSDNGGQFGVTFYNFILRSLWGAKTG